MLPSARYGWRGDSPIWNFVCAMRNTSRRLFRSARIPEDILADAPKGEQVCREGRQLTVTFSNAGAGLSVCGDELAAMQMLDGERNPLYCQGQGGSTGTHLVGGCAGFWQFKFMRLSIFSDTVPYEQSEAMYKALECFSILRCSCISMPSSSRYYSS